jgi:hypothetical protein
MNKKTKEDFIKHINSLIEKYKKLLNLELQEIEVKDGETNAGMSIDVNYPYKNSMLNFSDGMFNDWARGVDVSGYVLHELCHIYTEPLYLKSLHRFVGKTEIEDEREVLTENICQLIRRCLKNNC